MTYLMVQLLFWWLLALIAGGYVGWSTCSGGKTDWMAGWFKWGVGAFLVGMLLAVFKALPDRTGYFLDSALVLFAAYILGCLLGGFVRVWQTGSGAMALAGASHGASTGAVATALREPAPMPPPAPLMAAAPAPAAPAPGEENLTGRKPSVLLAPRDGKGDDLKRIRGIGRQNEGRLHALGVWHFDQIAAWAPDEVEWVGGYLAFPGRIEREDWVAQAKVLASGADTEFSKRVDRGEVATSKDDGMKGERNVADLSGLGAAKPKH